MNAKERMTQALTDMLENGETLMHPIYGVLLQGADQYYGYFGFTEKFLLVALLSPFGQTVTDMIRVPLDIRSVKITEKSFLNQRQIDINFNEGSPCRILVSPKVLGIDSQKDNFPQFISHLKSKSPIISDSRNKFPNESIPKLSQADGIKVRKQYFNFILYAFLAMLLPIIPMIYILECQRDGISIFASGELFLNTVRVALPILATFFIPLILLSLGSKYIFGKTVAVISEKGLQLEDTFIPWKDISSVRYTAPRLSKISSKPAYITVTVNSSKKGPYDIEVLSFTLYGLRKLRKYLPKETVRWEKGDLPFIVFMALLPTVIFLFIAIF